MKIEINTNLDLDKEQAGIVLGKALRLPKNETGVLVMTPAGKFVVVNKRGVIEREVKEVLPALVNASRKYCKLTQTELAEKINTTRATVVSWETGHRNPQLIVVMAILWICEIIDHWKGIEK